MSWIVFPASNFKQHQKDWDRLNQSTINSPVLDSSFVEHSLSAFGNGSEQLCLYQKDNKIDAMVVMVKSKFGVWDSYQPSQLPLGPWLNCSDEPLTKLLAGLAKKLPGIVLKLGITQQDPLLYQRPDDQKPLSTLDYIETAHVDATGEYEQYWSARSKNLRHNLKRQRNRLTKEGTDNRLSCITDPAEVVSAIAAYGKLESAGWKASNGTAISADNEQGEFYTNLMKYFCQNRQGYIYQYHYNDELVATDLCIAKGDTFVILKTTYDESIKTSSPAFLMRQDYFPELFSNETIKRIEFYGKLMDWHTKWSSDIRRLYHLNYRRV